MRMKQAIAAAILLTMNLAGMTADAPEVAISNGVIHARVYLPDAESGYYRGTRFDWSGAISSLAHAWCCRETASPSFHPVRAGPQPL